MRKFRATCPRDLPARNARCAISLGLIFVFFVYGMVYLAAMTGKMSSSLEMKCFLVMNAGVKLNILLVFVGIRSSQFYELLVDLLVNKRVNFEKQYAIANDFGDVEQASTLPRLR